MEGIVYIFIAILFFLYIIFMAILYIGLYNLVEKLNIRIYKRYNRKYRRLILRVLKDISNDKEGFIITKKTIDRIGKNINNIYFRQVLKDTLYFYNINSPKNMEIPILMGHFDEHIEKMIYKYKVGKNLRDSKIIYLLGIYRVNKPYINKFLIKILDGKSINLKVSALNSLALIGNQDYFLKGLNIVSSNKTYINKNIFLDIVNDYTGSRENLFEKLMYSFNNYSNSFKLVTIECFIYFNYTEGNKMFLELLKSEETEKEVRLGILRYFTKFKYEGAKETILELLKNEKFEIRSTSSKALSNYKSNDVIKKLLHSLRDKNWYVRFNTANTLLDFNLGKEIIYIVEKLKDRYALDIIYYTMFERNEIDYDEYILRIKEGEGH